MCTFKTLIGGWTTSHRMHEPIHLPCIFGCRGEQDTQLHYLQCFPLWHIATTVLGIEAPWSISSRLGVTDPSPEKAQLLALVFMVYHNTKSRVKELGGLGATSSNRVQRIAAECARCFVHHIV